MAATASDILVTTLIDWGVDTIFGIPGDGINGIMEALRTRQDKIRFIQVRHEEAAAFMACGYAKFTGKLGVCLATSGPGGIHLLNGLYDAKLDGAAGARDHRPAVPRPDRHTYTQQDVELDKLFMDVAVYNARVMGAGARRRTSSSSPAARRSPTAASPTSPSRSTSRTRTVKDEPALEAQRAGPRLRR